MTSLAWSRYWEKGFLTTFTAEAGENYTGLIKGFWIKTFSELAGEGNIVDLGAGNGALLSLALDFSFDNDKKFNLTAVDYASVVKQSSFYKNNNNVRVLENTKIEKTGLPGGEFDLCVSQFGFEYSDIPETAEEIMRLLKPSGRFSALIHHSASMVSVASANALTEINLCRNSELTKTASQLLRRIEKLKKKNKDLGSDKEAKTLRSKFNSTIANLLQAKSKMQGGGHIEYYLNEVAGVFGSQARNFGLRKKLMILKTVEEESALYETRMNAMVEASKSAEEINTIVDMFKSIGFKDVQFSELGALQEVLAWTFTARR